MIEGLLESPDQERWLFKAARRLPDGSNIVEVGSFKGRSTCCLAYGCRGRSTRVFAVDTFKGNDVDFHHSDFFEEFCNNIEIRGLSEYVTPVPGLSQEIAKTWDKPIHFLFIDGSHQYQDVLADFHGFLPHVMPGGTIALHDVCEGWPGVLRAWRDDISPLLVNLGTCGSISYGRTPD